MSVSVFRRARRSRLLEHPVEKFPLRRGRVDQSCGNNAPSRERAGAVSAAWRGSHFGLLLFAASCRLHGRLFQRQRCACRGGSLWRTIGPAGFGSRGACRRATRHPVRGRHVQRGTQHSQRRYGLDAAADRIQRHLAAAVRSWVTPGGRQIRTQGDRLHWQPSSLSDQSAIPAATASGHGRIRRGDFSRDAIAPARAS